MSHRRLTPADLAGLPAAGHEALLGHPSWARAAMDAWGLCGVGDVGDHGVTAYLLVCPALHVPRDHPLALGANADAAALLAASPDAAPRLVQGLAARLVGHRTITAVDAAVGTPGTVLAPSPEWLARCGFHPLASDPCRHRLDLTATRSWLPDLGDWVRRLSDLVQPTPPPEPAGRFGRRPA